MRILVHAPVGSTSGYGRDGIGLIEALIRQDHVVDLVPLTVGPPIPAQIAQLLTYPITDGYDLEIHHVPPGSVQVGAYNKMRSKKVVLWTMWEWDTYPKDTPGYENTQAYVKNYDHVVGYTQQTLDAFNSEGFLGEDQPTSVVQGGFDPKPWTPVYEAPEEVQQVFPYRKFNRGTFKFAMVGHLGPRKNPYTVLKAFNELKEELGDDFDAEMLFKTGYPILPPNYDAPGVRVIQEINWTDIQMRQFYWSIDCLINNSWGEGKNLPSLEATMCGTPIILNDNPGHRGWAHPGIQPLVPSTIQSMDGKHVGRFTSKDDLKKAMLDIYHNRPVAFDRAKQLASYVSKRATWDYRVKQFGESIGINL